MRVLIRPKSGKGMFSMADIINDWLKDVQQGKRSTINIILPKILSPEVVIRQLEDAARNAWNVLVAA